MTEVQQVEALGAPFTLPCGTVCPNRLAKAAMEELLGGDGDPNSSHFKLYEEWAKGDWGMVLTGNVMVSPTHLGSPGDIVVPFPESKTFDRSVGIFKEWAVASHAGGSKAPVIMQLCHTGRQSMRGSGRPPLQPALAPSAVPLNAGNSLLAKAVSRVMWGTPKEMTESDIDDVVAGFVQGARIARDTGFEGVELHCSHGYLLAQFLSPNVNIRTDSYGESPRARTKLMFRIIDAVRKECPASTGFCLGIKLNSSDYVQGGLTEKDALDNVRWIAEHGGVDFIEISGGTYENAAMLGEDNDGKKAVTPTPSARGIAREAFFQSFASEARALLLALPAASLPSPAPAIMVTGGFRTRAGMAQALISDSTDFVGLGRPACADPALPKTLLDKSIAEARSPKYSVKGSPLLRFVPFGLIGPGISTIFHTMLLAQVAKGEKPDYHMTLLEGAWRVWIRTALLRGWVWIAMVAAVLVGLVSTVRA